MPRWRALEHVVETVEKEIKNYGLRRTRVTVVRRVLRQEAAPNAKI